MTTTDLTQSSDKDTPTKTENHGAVESELETDLNLNDTAFCENCKLPLTGPFCAQCGQEADSKLKYFWVVIMHVLDDILSFDSRAMRTLWPLMLKPGFLTNEYFAGRRVHYVPPIRLYLFISIVFFITLKFFVVADNQEVSGISSKIELATQVKKQIDLLKDEQQGLQKELTPTIETQERISAINADITRFKSYIEDIKQDDEEGADKNLLKLTKEIVTLELEQFQSVLPPDKQKRLDDLISSRLKIIEGRTLTVEGIDSDDQSKIKADLEKENKFHLDLLSEEDNAKAEAFLQELIKKIAKTFSSDPGPLIEQVTGELLPQLMFVLLPLFALLLKVMFAFSKRLYLEHLTVALHSHCFIFLALFLSELFSVLEDKLLLTFPFISGLFAFLSGALFIWIPIYLFIMQRRVYKQGMFFTSFKFFIIGTFYVTMIGITGLVAVIWGVMGS
ncbi:MAG: DUF3667 domain-containing protein [Colwellia sp.]